VWVGMEAANVLLKPALTRAAWFCLCVAVSASSFPDSGPWPPAQTGPWGALLSQISSLDESLAALHNVRFFAGRAGFDLGLLRCEPHHILNRAWE
jgi:hypothetical protein